jgi:hypothetical protein
LRPVAVAAGLASPASVSIRFASDETSMTALLCEVFSADGPLAGAIPGYRPRAQQLELAEHIAAAMNDYRVLVAEAGTGTGKTYAYLVPALLSGTKVIVSTGTKTLQDQLFQRDLPTVRGALGVPVTIALLKGRANYLCHYHLERSLRTAGSFARRSGASAGHRALGQGDEQRRQGAVHRGAGRIGRPGEWSPRRATTVWARTVRTRRNAS